MFIMQKKAASSIRDDTADADQQRKHYRRLEPSYAGPPSRYIIHRRIHPDDHTSHNVLFACTFSRPGQGHHDLTVGSATRHDESDVGGVFHEPALLGFRARETVECKATCLIRQPLRKNIRSLAPGYVTVEQRKVLPISACRQVSTISTFEGVLGRPERSSSVHSFAMRPMTEHMGPGWARSGIKRVSR
ncbi:hypothetical protein Q7P35_012558 [Cladosporium inversicolor]